jgi:hypothetical protein
MEAWREILIGSLNDKLTHTRQSQVKVRCYRARPIEKETSRHRFLTKKCLRNTEGRPEPKKSIKIEWVKRDETRRSDFWTMVKLSILYREMSLSSIRRCDRLDGIDYVSMTTTVK